LLSAVLGTAASFAVLGASTVTNTGATTVVGNVGVSPGTSITGFGPGVISDGALHAGDAVATQAHADLVTAYGVIAGEASPPANDLTGSDLGGLTLTPGVYHFDTSASLAASTILTLNAEGNPNARFDFQIGTTLITGSNSAIHVINGGEDDNVYFQVGTSATLGSDTAFEGNILADQSVTLTTGASILEGRALALVGAVTMDTNQVSAVEADVSVTNTTAAGPVLAGDSIAYTITVANAGPDDAQTVALSDLVPAGTTFVSDTQTSGPTFTLTNPAVGGTGAISGTIGTLALGASASFNVVALVSPSTPQGAIVSDTANVTAATSDPNLANNSATVTTNVQTQADVSVTDTTAAGPVLAGNTIDYTITVANAGPSDAQTVALTDVVPANTTFVSDTQTSGPTFTVTSPAVGGTGTISGTIGTLASGASASFNVVALVSPSTPAGTTISDTASLAAATADLNLANNSQTVTTLAQTQADVSLTNTTAAGPVLAGNTIDYTITVANAGPSDAQAVALTDVVPANTTFVSDTQTSGPTFTVTSPAVGGTGTISGTIGTLPLGASASFNVVALVSPSTPAGTTISDTASLAAATADPNLANNSQTVTKAVATQADVSVTNTTAVGAVLAGNTIDYTITVANAGPSDAQTVALTDLVPAHTTFVSDTQTSGPTFTLTRPAVGGTGTIGGTIGTLASGASASFNVVALVSPSTPSGDTVVNTADVTAATSDTNLANNSQTNTTAVVDVLVAPVVSGISPTSGPPSGGTLVTITGTNFSGATGVDFGSTPGTNFTVVNNTTITVDDPAQTTGVIDVTVLSPGGNSTAFQSDQFTYVPGLTVVPVTGTGLPGSAVSLAPLSSASSTNGGALSLSVLTQPALGTVSIVTVGGAQQFLYHPGPGAFTTDSFTYQVTDSLGGTATATATVNYLGVGIVSSSLNPGKTDLVIVGAPGSHTITIVNSGKKQKVTIDGVVQGTYAFTGRVFGFALSGNDDFNAKTDSRSFFLYGGAGNNTLIGGLGADVIIGGAGNDYLNGRAGRNVLIGGGGTNKLTGPGGTDLLIAGSTPYDAPTLANQAALLKILSVWQTTKRSKLPTSVSGFGGNGTPALNASTITPDDSGDDLIGTTRSWFFGNFTFNGGTDTFNDGRHVKPNQALTPLKGELVTQI
jgi:uncharacterized repeat protein (TIGR01451 family)